MKLIIKLLALSLLAQSLGIYTDSYAGFFDAVTQGVKPSSGPQSISGTAGAPTTGGPHAGTSGFVSGPGPQVSGLITDIRAPQPSLATTAETFTIEVLPDGQSFVATRISDGKRFHNVLNLITRNWDFISELPPKPQ